MDAFLGPAGNLIGFRASAVNVTPEASASYLTTLGGRRKAQLTPHQPRSWSVSIGAATPAQLGQLSGLVQGLYGPPPWVFVEPWAAVTNLLPPPSALLKPGTWVGGGTAGGTVTLADGTKPVHSIVDATEGWKNFTPVPVIPGRPVTGGLWGTGASSYMLGLEFKDAAGAIITRPEWTVEASASGPLQHGSLSAVAPAGAATVTLRTTALRAALPSVTLTPDAEAWTEGGGAPLVVAEGLSKAVVMAVRDTPVLRRADVSFTVMEVGNA